VKSYMNLPQYGGEGKTAYKGKKSDMKLKQHGGEGGLSTKTDMTLLPRTQDTGPGRDLTTQK
jgi:hypothetical protein